MITKLICKYVFAFRQTSGLYDFVISRNDFHHTTPQIFPMSPFRRQREKRINLVLRQPQHPADLAIRGTELVAEFPGEIKSLRFGQVFNREDIVI